MTDSMIFEMAMDKCRKIECNLYSEGIRARLSAMPISLSDIESIAGEGPAVLITSVEVAPSERHKGYASSLLEAACKTADFEGIVLCLQLSPDGTSEVMNESRLRSWYESYGFKSDSYPHSMVRIPLREPPLA